MEASNDATYAKYNTQRLSKANLAPEQTDALIRTRPRNIDQCNRKTGRKIQFGVSPFGIWGIFVRTATAPSPAANRVIRPRIVRRTRKWD